VLLKQVLREERVGRFDLVYFAQRNSEEDRHYFKEYVGRARCTQFIEVRRARFSIFSHIASYLAIADRFKSSEYDKIILASIDSLALRRFVAKHRNAEVVTFDDGSANVNLRSRYLVLQHRRRERVYAALFGAPTTQSFRRLVARHYSIYPGFANIMPREIVRYLGLFPTAVAGGGRAKEVTIFIGQPVDSASDAARAERIKAYVAGMKLDFYVQHPREESPLIAGAPLLDKKGRVAEEAIFELGKDHRVTILGGFSSVLLNIAPKFARKVMILNGDSGNDHYLATLGKRAGCEVIFL
jgi:hypothetical protein